MQYTQNSEDAEEISQDVFLSVHENLTKFRGESLLKTWLYKITINKSLDHIKSQKREKRSGFFKAVRIDDSDQEIHLPDMNHPGIALEHKEALGRLFKCINTLPDNQKTVIILLKIEQKTQAQTAEIMNISSKAVESLFQRAKTNLEKLLKQYEGK